MMATFTSEKVYDVVIVGGGIAGLATAIGLIRRGISNILVLEKASTMHPVGASLAIFSNGLKALEYLSPPVATKVRASSIPIETMILKDLEGNVVRETRPPNHTSVNYLVWYLLQQYLGDELPDGVLRLGHAVQSFQIGEDGIVTITACTSNSGATPAPAQITCTSIQTRVLVGADGINSPIRERLFGTGAVEKHCHGKRMFRTVLPSASVPVEHVPPTGTNLSFQGDEEGKVFHYRETAKGILTVTAMARSERYDAVSDDAPYASPERILPTPSPEERREQMVQAFDGYPAEVQSLLQHVPPEAVYINTIQDIDVLDRWSKGPVVLIGDAAHAMSPSMGQGANQGLEDACVLVHGLVRAWAAAASTSAAPNGGHEEEEEEDMACDSLSSVAIASLLDEIWRSRVERVRRIHAASRARSLNNNRSSKSRPIDMGSVELKKVLEEIDAWDAPVDG